MNKEDISTLHKMLLYLIERLEDENYIDIKAPVPNLEKPYGIAWNSTIPLYAPDATAEKNDSFYLFQIITKDTISNTDMHQKMRAFSEFALNSNSNFVIVIPENLADEARRILDVDDIFAVIWTS